MPARGECDVAGVEVTGSLVMDERVITEWCQPLRSSKNAKPPKEAFVYRQFLCGRIQFLESARSTHRLQCEKEACSGRLCKRQPTEMEFDHELHLWFRSKKSRKITLTLVWKDGQSGRKITHSVDVINTGRSAGTILSGCNYAGHWPK